MLSYQTCVTFLSLSYLLTLCCFVNFSRLIKPLSSYQYFAIFSPFGIYSLFTLSTHPINAPAVHTTNTAFSPVLSCARSLHQYVFLNHQASLAIVPFWYGGIEALLGGFSKNNLLPSHTLPHLWFPLLAHGLCLKTQSFRKSKSSHILF